MNPYDNLKPERQPDESFEEYKFRRRMVNTIVKYYLKNGKRREESTKE